MITKAKDLPRSPDYATLHGIAFLDNLIRELALDKPMFTEDREIRGICDEAARGMKRKASKFNVSDPDSIEREKLRLMRAARTKVEYSHGIGGLPRKGKGHRRAPITLAATPWDGK